MGDCCCRAKKEEGTTATLGDRPEQGIASASPREVLPYDCPAICSRCFPRASKQDPSAEEKVQEIKGARMVAVQTPGGMLECILVEFGQSRQNHKRPRVLVHFHGNGELAWQTAQRWAEPFHVALDVNFCFFVEYRGYGGSTGTPSFCKMQDDFSAVFEALKASTDTAACDGIDLVVYGRSIGSIFALAFAAKHVAETVGLILESGIADIAEWVAWYVSMRQIENPKCLFQSLDMDPKAASACADAHLNTAARLKQYVGPLLVLHTKGDTIVSVNHARSFHRLAAVVRGRAVNSLVTWERGGHNDIHQKNIAEYLQELGKFSKSIFDGA